MDSERWSKGLENYKRLTGCEENIFAEMNDFGDIVLEFAFGDLYSRGTLTWKERQIATMAVQIALGREPQLKIHMKAALHIGVTVKEIEEVLIQTAVYAGFPAAMNGYRVLKEIRRELGPDEGAQHP